MTGAASIWRDVDRTFNFGARTFFNGSVRSDCRRQTITQRYPCPRHLSIGEIATGCENERKLNVPR